MTDVSITGSLTVTQWMVISDALTEQLEVLEGLIVESNEPPLEPRGYCSIREWHVSQQETIEDAAAIEGLLEDIGKICDEEAVCQQPQRL